MKKTITILMILLALCSVAFAKAGFTVNVGGSYDFVNVRDIDRAEAGEYWRGHTFGVAAGVTYNFSDHFLAYYDGTFGFVAAFQVGDSEVKPEGDHSIAIATTHHAGVAYDFDMDKLDLQVGAGFTYTYAGLSTTGKIGDKNGTLSVGVTSLGVGLYGNVGYKISEGFSINLTVHPDFMIFSADTATVSTSESDTDAQTIHTTSDSYYEYGVAFSFKFNASVGVTFKF